MGAGVWSLVGALLGSRLTFALFALFSAKWLPKWEYSPALARELFGYGKFLWVCAILGAGGEALDKIVVGRFWGARILGCYQISFTVARLPAAVLVNMFERICFPAFSALKDDKKLFSETFLRTFGQISALMIPFSLGLFALSREFVSTFYGDKWEAAIPFLRVLAFFGLFQYLAPAASSALKALGAPKMLMRLSIFYYTLLLVLMALLSNLFGSIGVCYSLAATAGIVTTTSYLLVRKRLKLALTTLLIPFLRSLICSTIMALGVALFRWQVSTKWAFSAALSLVCCTVVGVFLYLVASLVLNRTVLHELKNSAKAVLLGMEDERRIREKELVGVGLPKQCEGIDDSELV